MLVGFQGLWGFTIGTNAPMTLTWEGNIWIGKV